MVGSAILRRLGEDKNLTIIVRDRSELDLTRQDQVEMFFANNNVEEVYLAAAKVGGIHANNTYPADFIYQNLIIEANIIQAAFRAGVTKLLFLGSSCIYPKAAEQPISENALLGGKLEATNEPYAIAKIAGIKLCESYNRQFGESLGVDYRIVMPANLYGPGDNYHPENSHVVAALIRRFHLAKVSGQRSVEIWGTGTPRREFLHVDDLASACVHVMGVERDRLQRLTSPMCAHINAGCDHDITIRDLATLIRDIVGFAGEINFDLSKPDGTPRKLMDSKLLRKIGWQPSIGLADGIKMTYQSYLSTEC